MDHRGPGTGNPGRPDLLPQTYAGTVGPESPPTKESRGRGQDWGSIFGFMEIWDRLCISLQWSCYMAPKWVDGSGSPQSDKFLT